MLPKQSQTYLLLAVLFSFSLLIAFARAHTYYEPLEWDITTYAVIAHEMLGGRELYSDLWDNKPPGIHLTYAAAETIVGYGRQSIYLLNVIIAIITLLGIYLAGTAVSKTRSGGLWAAACWAIVSNDLALHANQPNVEIFINACLIWVFVLLVQAEQHLGYRKAIFIGLLFAIASIYKQIAVFAAVLLGCAYLIMPPAKTNLKNAFGHLLVIASIGVIAWGVVFGYFAVTGRFEAFYEAVFLFNQLYAQSMNENFGSGILSNLSAGLQPKLLFPSYFTLALPLGTLAMLGLLIGLYKRKRVWFLLLAYAIATFIMVATPGKFYPHYYQLWLPLLCVAGGWAIIELSEVINASITKMKPYTEKIMAVSLISGLLYLQLPLYFISPLEWSYRKYGTFFIFSEMLTEEINKILKPDETFYQWGGEFFFYTQRRPPTGIISYLPLIGGPLVQKLSQRTIEDLERNKPELVILPQYPPLNHPVVAWIASRYRPHPRNNQYKVFSFYVRRGGKLESRLLGETKL